MSTNVVLGQFVPGNSILHKLDPRIKLILLFSLMIIIFMAWSYTSLAIVTFTIIFLVLLSLIPIKMYLKNAKFIFLMTFFSSFLNLFYGTGDPIFKLGFLTITESGIQNSIVVILRICNLLILSTCFMFTTSPNDMTHGLDSVMSPLKRFNINVEDITVMITIALRFIPITLDETNKIINAQKSRGADMYSKKTVSKFKAFIPVIIPLFSSTFRHAYELAIAMESRCYGLSENRTRFKVFKLDICDFIALLFVILVGIGVIICNKVNMLMIL